MRSLQNRERAVAYKSICRGKPKKRFSGVQMVMASLPIVPTLGFLTFMRHLYRHLLVTGKKTSQSVN